MLQPSIDAQEHACTQYVYGTCVQRGKKHLKHFFMQAQKTLTLGGHNSPLFLLSFFFLYWHSKVCKLLLLLPPCLSWLGLPAWAWGRQKEGGGEQSRERQQIADTAAAAAAQIEGSCSHYKGCHLVSVTLCTPRDISILRDIDAHQD